MKYSTVQHIGILSINGACSIFNKHNICGKRQQLQNTNYRYNNSSYYGFLGNVIGNYKRIHRKR